MPKIILDEKAQSLIQSVLDNFPISQLANVQKLIEILNYNIEKEVPADGNASK